jgi:ATP-dependent Clp protease ATP-binding subunit ClpA
MQRRRAGFGGAAGPQGEDDRAFERAFTPEFRNRLDARIPFAPLGPDTMGRIVDRLVEELRGRLAPRGVRLTVAPSARTWLATRGYDPANGARPLAKLLQEAVAQPLSEQVLFGRLEGGGEVRVEAEGPKLRFRYR